jgi:hypothetical protein
MDDSRDWKCRVEPDGVCSRLPFTPHDDFAAERLGEISADQSVKMGFQITVR